MGLLLSSSCVLCDCSVSRTISLCQSCEDDLPRLQNACERCGLPLDVANEREIMICGYCIRVSSSVDYTLCLYHYQAPIDYLITTLKYNQQLTHAAILGYLLLARLECEKMQDYPDCIIPVPLHQKRLVKRGFNQSLEMARSVADKYKIPIDTKMVKRKKRTLAQAELNAAQRLKNVKNCFDVEIKLTENYSHVVIVDDVVTTGATINELATQLKKAGIKKVGVWSIARAVLGR